MQELKANTQVKVVIGPFVDESDGKTPETGITLGAADEAELMKHDAAAVVDISGATWAAITSMDGYYNLTLTTSHTDTEGMLTIAIQDDSVCLPVIARFKVLSEAAYDSKYAAKDTGYMDVNIKAVSEDETAADNLEAAYDGTGYDVGGIDVSELNTAVDAIGSDGTGLTEAGGTGDHLTAVPWNSSWDAEVQSECNDALVALGLDHLLSTSVTGTDVADDSIIAQLVDDAATADWDNYDNTANSLQALRVRGDAAWTTGGGGSISDILDVYPLIPTSIDLADTATVRLGLQLRNALDDLPTTGEITPGTISIDRKAIGGTSWTSVVSDAACSEAAGLIYYDEVFDSGSTYAEGDSIRITFKSQKITVSANDYEITGSGGVIWQTEIRQTMRGTDSAYTGTPPTAAAIRSEMDSNSTQLAAIVADTNELQGDWADGGRLDLILDARSSQSSVDTIDSNVDAILVDTGTTLPAAIPSVSDIWTTALTESYGTDGSALTGAQLAYLILGNVSEFAISSTTKTVKQLNGSSTAATYTLDDADNPTSVTRTT